MLVAVFGYGVLFMDWGETDKPFAGVCVTPLEYISIERLIFLDPQMGLRALRIDVDCDNHSASKT